jgi:hypothetical protein
MMMGMKTLWMFSVIDERIHNVEQAVWVGNGTRLAFSGTCIYGRGEGSWARGTYLLVHDCIAFECDFLYTYFQSFAGSTMFMALLRIVYVPDLHKGTARR